jgi:hypothetical protein
MTAESVNTVPMEDIGDNMAKSKRIEDSKALIVSRIVKRFGNGGCWVSLPANMLDQEVWIIPKDQIEGLDVKLKGAKQK